MVSNQALWEHPDKFSTHMARFMRAVNVSRNLKLSTFQDLYSYSIGPQRENFWDDAWKYFGIIHEGSYRHVIEPGKRMDQVPKFFTGVRLNFAENILFSSDPDGSGRNLRREGGGTTGKQDAKVALTEVREGVTEVRNVTWAELRARVARLSAAMRARGVKKGDRVAVVASNSVDTLVVFLAVTALGGLFSSSSTDMGVKGILDRLLQITPVWLFMDDGFVYNGKTGDLRQKMADVVKGMSDIKEFRGVVSMPRWREPIDVSQVAKTITLEHFQDVVKGTPELKFERVDFADPFLVVYSSGTTGQPKCIVHSVGGVLTSAFKEGLLHRDIGPTTVALQYTTTGWIMYLTSILSLLHGARAVLYDGSPFQPDPIAFVKLIGEQHVTKLGVSPRYFSTLMAAGISPQQTTDLSHLKSVTSTGMVLPTALFHWFYSPQGFPRHVQLANISGGTDLAGCFAMENPHVPLRPGGTMGPSLGTKVEIFDATRETPAAGPAPQGIPAPAGEPGELVATASFPNMPVMFWPGDAAAQRKYFDAYFARFDNVWTHGDFVERMAPGGDGAGLVFHGRADGVLNPSGVRFGSAEIYNVLEQRFSGVVQDSVVVGQRRPADQDEKVMLFLKMAEGKRFTEALVAEVKKAIAEECSKRHVPAYVFETPEIPTTVNLKKVELPVKQIVSGKVIKPSGTLLNPESLQYYYQFAKVEELVKAKSKL
ncbi:hypothetical protein FH972_024372 [Carpinus fangiana]|uniref:AMP-dependent synthetase/ligase domain-containing protein n=1 Tax=Carpinus fangiana TaxID=176857 RepID=A0A5N6L0D4_9ROSI|nr:hypothetical protein FH972_024372 [Carpinus fangiana]